MSTSIIFRGFKPCLIWSRRFSKTNIYGVRDRGRRLSQKHQADHVIGKAGTLLDDLGPHIHTEPSAPTSSISHSQEAIHTYSLFVTATRSAGSSLLGGHRLCGSITLPVPNSGGTGRIAPPPNSAAHLSCSYPNISYLLYHKRNLDLDNTLDHPSSSHSSPSAASSLPLRSFPHRASPGRISLHTKRRHFSSTAATMAATRLDGTAIAKAVRERLGAEIAAKQKQNPRYSPSLRIIQGLSNKILQVHAS